MSYAILGTSILFPIVVIALVAGVLSCIGVYIGKYLKNSLGGIMEIIGGIVLMLLAIKILFDHGVFSF